MSFRSLVNEARARKDEQLGVETALKNRELGIQQQNANTNVAEAQSQANFRQGSLGVEQNRLGFEQQKYGDFQDAYNQMYGGGKQQPAYGGGGIKLGTANRAFGALGVGSSGSELAPMDHWTSLPGHWADGGPVVGLGPPDVDSVDAKLAPGEYVLPAAVVEALGGVERLDAIVTQITGQQPGPEYRQDDKMGLADGGPPRWRNPFDLGGNTAFSGRQDATPNGRQSPLGRIGSSIANTWLERNHPLPFGMQWRPQERAKTTAPAPATVAQPSGIARPAAPPPSPPDNSFAEGMKRAATQEWGWGAGQEPIERPKPPRFANDQEMDAAGYFRDTNGVIHRMHPDQILKDRASKAEQLRQATEYQNAQRQRIPMTPELLDYMAKTQAAEYDRDTAYNQLMYNAMKDGRDLEIRGRQADTQDARLVRQNQVDAENIGIARQRLEVDRQNANRPVHMGNDPEGNPIIFDPRTGRTGLFNEIYGAMGGQPLQGADPFAGGR